VARCCTITTSFGHPSLSDFRAASAASNSSLSSRLSFQVRLLSCLGKIVLRWIFASSALCVPWVLPDLANESENSRSVLPLLACAFVLWRCWWEQRRRKRSACPAVARRAAVAFMGAHFAGSAWLWPGPRRSSFLLFSPSSSASRPAGRPRATGQRASKPALSARQNPVTLPPGLRVPVFPSLRSLHCTVEILVTHHRHVCSTVRARRLCTARRPAGPAKPINARQRSISLSPTSS
jgi:hypothetical protein